MLAYLWCSECLYEDWRLYCAYMIFTSSKGMRVVSMLFTCKRGGTCIVHTLSFPKRFPFHSLVNQEWSQLSHSPIGAREAGGGKIHRDRAKYVGANYVCDSAATHYTSTPPPLIAELQQVDIRAYFYPLFSLLYRKVCMWVLSRPCTCTGFPSIGGEGEGRGGRGLR